jgi:hypothetical protein
MIKNDNIDNIDEIEYLKKYEELKKSQIQEKYYCVLVPNLQVQYYNLLIRKSEFLYFL